MNALSILGLAAGACLSTACGPLPTSEAQLPDDASNDVWVLLVHGSGDGPSRWAAPMVDQLAPRATTPDRVQWVAYDWAAAAADKLAAAGNAEREGRAIAQVVLQRRPTHLHVIAHSAGAFVAYGLEQALAGQPGRPTLHLTLLDPFLGVGLDFEWGRGRIGQASDFVDGYLDTGDGVPGTEVAVAAAHTFDVTTMAERAGRFPGKEGHWWPTDVYPRLAPVFELSREVTARFDPAALKARFPPGQTETVP